jgi:hypothetical protein
VSCNDISYGDLHGSNMQEEVKEEPLLSTQNDFIFVPKELKKKNNLSQLKKIKEEEWEKLKHNINEGTLAKSFQSSMDIGHKHCKSIEGEQDFRSSDPSTKKIDFRLKNRKRNSRYTLEEKRYLVDLFNKNPN